MISQFRAYCLLLLFIAFLNPQYQIKASNFNSGVYGTPTGTKYRFEMRTDPSFVFNAPFKFDVTISTEQIGLYSNQISLEVFWLIFSETSDYPNSQYDPHKFALEVGFHKYANLTGPNENYRYSDELLFTLWSVDDETSSMNRDFPTKLYILGQMSIREDGVLYDSPIFLLGSVSVNQKEPELDYFPIFVIWTIMIFIFIILIRFSSVNT